MECSFILGLANGPGLLQQIRLDIGPGNVSANVEIDADKFPLRMKNSIRKRK